MLVLPLKVSTRIDLSRPLAAWIDANCHPNSLPYRDDLLRLSSLRHSVTRSMCTSSLGHARAVSEGAPADLREYHAALLLCEILGFPVRESGDGGVPGLELYWEDAFAGDDVRGGGIKQKKETKDASPKKYNELHRSNMLYERCCVLWNVAAMESHLADLDQQGKTPEGLKKASARYNAAAGMFVHLKDVLSDHPREEPPPPTADLSVLVLDLCELIMLAQGQACVYQVAKQATNNPPPPDSLLAKIAAGAADLYDEAHGVATSSIRVPREVQRWCKVHLQARAFAFRARAEYHESAAVLAGARKTGTGYGVEIARLARSANLLESVVNLCAEESSGASSSSNMGLLEEVTVLRAIVAQRRAEAEEDNRQMYREAVPRERSLEPIEGKVISKSTALDDSLNPCALSKPLFVDLSLK